MVKPEVVNLHDIAEEHEAVDNRGQDDNDDSNHGDCDLVDRLVLGLLPEDVQSQDGYFGCDDQTLQHGYEEHIYA